MTVLIDYGAGNIKSVEKAFNHLGERTILSSDKSEILSGERIVLPGVGSFGSAMECIKSMELDKVIKEAIHMGKPFLGICLGYQMLFSGSEEDGGVEGLSIFEGDVKGFIPDKEHKVPQIGWNNLFIRDNTRLFENLDKEPFVYFVHSYYVKAKDGEIVAAKAQYINSFDAAIETGNVFGCQFHPEKSSEVGLYILKNFIGIK